MMNGKQRYRCKVCGFNYTTGFRGKPIELRQEALKLYLDGMGFRAIGRVLNVSNVTVLNWVRANGSAARAPANEPGAPDEKSPEGDAASPPLHLLVDPAILLARKENCS
jgi:hypothetical protein